MDVERPRPDPGAAGLTASLFRPRRRPPADIARGARRRAFPPAFARFAVAALAAAALVLLVAGLYALMSFTVSARAYEIAIRTALGADAGHVVRIVLARSLGQLTAGIAIGGDVGAVLASQFAVDASTTNHWWAVVGAVAAVMTVVGALACSAPTVRALRIQPIEALKALG